MECNLDVVGRGEIWAVRFARDGSDETDLLESSVFNAVATLGERRHYSRWSLSGILARELDRQRIADGTSVLRGLTRVYRRRFDALLGETDPHRMLKIEHLGLFAPVAGRDPVARIEHEIETLLFALSSLLTRLPTGITTLEVPTADVEWTAYEAQLRGLPIHRTLSDFYLAYAQFFRVTPFSDENLASAARRAGRLGLIALHAMWRTGQATAAPPIDPPSFNPQR